MIKSSLKAFVLFVVVFLSTGCAVTKLESTVSPGVNFHDLGEIFVVRFEPDRRGLHQTIADQLTLLGYPAAYGEQAEVPGNIDTLVTYQDNWQWDITNYMIRIVIHFRDGKTQNVIVSGESYRTSLARKSPEEMINETLIEILKKKQR